MNFFKKVGRPSEEEQMMIQAIERIIAAKGIPEDEIPECQSLEDLVEVKTLLESYDPPGMVPGDEPEAAPEPFAVFEEETEEPIPYAEPLEDWQPDESPGDDQQFIADDYDPFSDPIIERSYTKGQPTGTNGEAPDEDGLNLEETKPQLGDLPPAAKRRAAEQTADALLKGYARFAPMPFKWMAKISEGKVEKLAFNGELDLSLEVSEGVTFEDYMRQTNAQIDEIFEVEKETLDEIREPLIEVLLEQQLELTPTQRLTMAILSHLTQMFTVALNLRQQNNRILSYQKNLTAMLKGAKVAA
jgi:hypothetical protein